jgi:dTDP-4-dehydrorhamnose 3,5-epimerase
MNFRETSIGGVWIVELERHEDERGFFARTWDVEEFSAQGLNSRVVQCSVSYNRVRGTLRGLCYQVAPYEETKLIRCTAGAFYDVAVDLRPESPTFCRWVGVELSADNGLAHYIPAGCAHGFLTLVDDTEISYAISDPYVPEAERGARYDDPAFGIEWPGDVVVINERDASYPNFVRPSERAR